MTSQCYYEISSDLRDALKGPRSLLSPLRAWGTAGLGVQNVGPRARLPEFGSWLCRG